MKHDEVKKSLPWYRYGHVWMVIAGPAIVVVAALATGYVAMRGADPVVDADYYRHGTEINKTLAQKAKLPALEGRNHAATQPAEP
jgi:uncharacterized protein